MGMPFKTAIKFVGPYDGCRENCYIYVRHCDRVFQFVEAEDLDWFFNWIVSQFERADPDIFCDIHFKAWPQLRDFLLGQYQGIDYIQLDDEIVTYPQMRQGQSEDIQHYLRRAYKHRRIISMVKTRPNHPDADQIDKANAYLIRCFIRGLTSVSEHLKMELLRTLPDSLESAVHQVLALTKLRTIKK